jgi:hypothetical protein
MSVIQFIRDGGLWCGPVALARYAGQCLRKLNPLRYFTQAPMIRMRRPQPECVWVRPSSK